MGKTGILFIAFAALACFANGDVVGKAITLKTKPIVETTAQIMARDKVYGPKLPIRKIKTYEEQNEFEFDHLPSNPRSPASATWPPMVNDAPLNTRTSEKSHRGPLFSTPVNFGGPDLPNAGFVPPDSCGDVSPSSVLVCANGRMRSFDRLGNQTTINTTGNVFFNSVRTSGQNVSDPRVTYDRITKRWFLEIIDVLSSNNRICLAVSDKEVIDGTTVWTFFQFAQNVGGGASGFCDYATLGVDANGVYMGSNRFNGSFQNCDLFAVDKAALLGGTLVVTPFRNLITAGVAGMFTPWPCTNDDPSANVAFILGSDGVFTGTLSYRRVTYSAGTFTLSSNATITVPSNSSPLAMPISTSATTTGSVAALDLRLFYARVFRNRVTGDITVHAAQGVRMNSAGVGSSSGDRSGARWYNIGNVFSGSATLTAAGTVVDPATSGFQYCTIPSTAMNGQGHQFIGFSMGNLANSPGVAGAYRLAGDPLVSTPTLITPGVNYYAVQGTGVSGQRWGDYSFTIVDPRDMMSIWSFQEYCNANNSWQVRAVKVLAPAPTLTSVSPNTGTTGQTLNVVVTGTGLFDPDATYPDHLTATFGANITVNSVTWSNPTTATVNITVSPTAPTGARTVGVTNPDGQSTSGPTFTVVPKPVTGTLNLFGYTGPITGLQFIYEIRDSSTNALIETQTLTGLGAGNTFTLNTNQTIGTYKLRIMGVNRFLASSLPMTLSATGATGLTYSLLNGDASADNIVGVADFNLLRSAWGGIAPGAPYLEAADFNGDGIIGTTDFNIMRANWGAIGDN